MKKIKYIITPLLFITALLIWGSEMGQAAPTLNPAVDLSKPNFSYSPPLRKFVDSLPGVNAPNNLQQQIPLAAADTATYPGSDYYHIGLVEYRERMHSDLPALGTKLRGYVQIVPSGTPGAVALTTGNGLTMNIMDGATQLYGAARPHYLGPLILATKNRPVRIKFSNLLPVGASGNLFLPVDTTIMGAGEGPRFTNLANTNPCDPETQACAQYTENRATIHLHGGIPPWISDGTAHQWITPAGESTLTPYLKGASQQNVPDMAVPPAGSATFYWTNQQGGRLMFYHDHALGITGPNVYAGEAAGYLLSDPTEEDLLALAGAGVVPGRIKTNPATGAIVSADLAHLVPLVIQDKTFVYDNTVTPVGVAQDPSRYTAAAGIDPLWTWGVGGDLWFPHVYVPNQDPTDPSGANPLGRWDYGGWFWPIFPVVPPYYPPAVSHVPEAFMDTPVLNGTAYPHQNVDAAPYLLRILNACNDRMVNLQFYVADPAGYAIDATGASVTPGTGFGTEVKMIPATPRLACGATGAPAQPDCVCAGAITTNCFPASWAAQTPGMTPDILDSRISGIPDPTLRGPAMIQIGTEGGILPGPVLHENIPVGFEQNKRNIVVLNVLEKTLFLAPAERADVIVDFRKYAGKTIILYNDSPAPVPAGDPRYDFYTGNLDYSATGGANYQGGAPTTLPGYGPNTRTIMQFRVGAAGAPGAASGADSTAPVDYYNVATLTALQNRTTGLPAVYAAVQDTPIIPQAAYGLPDGPYNATYTDVAGATLARIQDHYLTFTPYGAAAPVTMLLNNPTIQELFDPQGRMNATLGVELPFTGALIQTTVPLGFIDPTTEKIGPNEKQLWKITHNGVDTHGIHFHLVNVQVVNRVGWDGAIRMTDPNELGWKDTVRMNPLEDIVVAMKAKVPTYPFAVPDSIRPLNPAMPVGSLFASLDPLTGNPITVTNAITNFGHEYTWHCHILGHEENDMMRPFVLENNMLYMDFAGTGIWQWNGAALSQINVTNPAKMVAAGGILYADFTGYGLYEWNGNAWALINSLSPTSMVALGTTLYADFAGYGLHEWNGTAWAMINAGHPAKMVAGGTMLYAYFTGYGLYQWNGAAWTMINTANPAAMVASGATLYADFSGYGLFTWNGTTWTMINATSPAEMVASGSNLYADFTGYGLYGYNGSSWSQVNTANPAGMAAFGSLLYADWPGWGLYKYDGNSWSQISATNPQRMLASGSVLFADFSGTGLSEWDLASWRPVSATSPTNIVSGVSSF